MSIPQYYQRFGSFTVLADLPENHLIHKTKHKLIHKTKHKQPHHKTISLSPKVMAIFFSVMLLFAPLASAFSCKPLNQFKGFDKINCFPEAPVEDGSECLYTVTCLKGNIDCARENVVEKNVFSLHPDDFEFIELVTSQGVITPIKKAPDNSCLGTLVRDVQRNFAMIVPLTSCLFKMKKKDTLDCKVSNLRLQSAWQQAEEDVLTKMLHSLPGEEWIHYENAFDLHFKYFFRLESEQFLLKPLLKFFRLAHVYKTNSGTEQEKKEAQQLLHLLDNFAKSYKIANNSGLLTYDSKYVLQLYLRKMIQFNSLNSDENDQLKDFFDDLFDEAFENGLAEKIFELNEHLVDYFKKNVHSSYLMQQTFPLIKQSVRLILKFPKE